MREVSTAGLPEKTQSQILHQHSNGPLEDRITFSARDLCLLLRRAWPSLTAKSVEELEVRAAAERNIIASPSCKLFMYFSHQFDIINLPSDMGC